MQKRFIQQRLLEQREIETERQILETERIRKEREEVTWRYFQCFFFLYDEKCPTNFRGLSEFWRIRKFIITDEKLELLNPEHFYHNFQIYISFFRYKFIYNLNENYEANEFYLEIIYNTGGVYNTDLLGVYNTVLLTAITPLTVSEKSADLTCNNTSHF